MLYKKNKGTQKLYFEVKLVEKLKNTDAKRKALLVETKFMRLDTAKVLGPASSLPSLLLKVT